MIPRSNAPIAVFALLMATLFMVSSPVSTTSLAQLWADDGTTPEGTPASWMSTRTLDRSTMESLRQAVGERDPERDYNVIVDGHGTGLAPPTAEAWEAMVGNVSVLDSLAMTPLSDSAPVDLSAELYFPKVGDQGNQGSCAAWAMTYYCYGYLEAKDSGWTEASAGNTSQLLSPAWTYNRVNGGSDDGSIMETIGQIIADWGVPTLSAMPYDDGDLLSWGDETAFREAPLHRAHKTVIVPFGEDTVNTLKTLLTAGTPVTFAIASSNLRGFSGGDYILSSAEYDSSIEVDHAQTLVGYDDSITDDGDIGAFKVVNSWGSSWGDGGYYWLTYKALEEIGDELLLTYIVDLEDYSPSLLAVWHLDGSTVNDRDFEIGLGSQASPLGKVSPLFVPSKQSHSPFMCLDISGLKDEYNADQVEFFLSIGLGNGYGQISSFRVERYSTTYVPGSPSHVSTQSPHQGISVPGTARTFLYDYESTALNRAAGTPLSLSTSGIAGWISFGGESSEGDTSVQSGDISNGETTTLTTIVDGPGSIFFDWMVSEDIDADAITFRVNGAVVYSAASTSWERMSMTVDAGTNVLTWSYERNGNGGGCAWVDNIYWSTVADTSLPTLTINSPFDDQELGSGSVKLDWTGHSPVGIDYYEVRVDGGDWSVATSPASLVLDDGQHTVEVRLLDNAGRTVLREVSFTVDSPSPLGTISGTLTDEQGHPVEGATVTLSDGQQTVTNSSGTFCFQASPGSYTVSVSMTGFDERTISVSSIEGEVSSLGVVSLSAAGSLDDTVETLHYVAIGVSIVVVLALVMLMRSRK